MFSIQNAGSSGDNVLYLAVCTVSILMHQAQSAGRGPEVHQCKYIAMYLHEDGHNWNIRLLFLCVDLDLLHENMKSVLFCFLRDPKRLEDDGHWKKRRR